LENGRPRGDRSAPVARAPDPPPPVRFSLALASPAVPAPSRPDPFPNLSDDPVEEAATYRRLAVRVIERAFRDITAPTCAAGDRSSAREFLAGSSMLLHWCSVADIDPRYVIARASSLAKR
jgi:hypothetical protein